MVSLQAEFVVWALVVHEDFMYWTSPVGAKLNKCNKFSCVNKTVSNKESIQTTDVFLYHPVAQLPCT